MSRRLAIVSLIPFLTSCATLGDPSAAWSKCARTQASSMIAGGSTASWPTVAEVPEGEEIQAVDLGPDPPGAVADAFHHVLHLAPRRNSFYLHQTGGFAGLDRIYGPVSLQGRCRVLKSSAP